MAWLVLLVSAVLEAVWATALAASDGFTQPVPDLVFALAFVASMAGLAYAIRTIPVGTGYAVWVGIGAALTVVAATVRGDEPMSPLKALFLVGIIAGVVGLKLVDHGPQEAGHPRDAM